jgi:hypothetical protein
MQFTRRFCLGALCSLAIHTPHSARAWVIPVEDATRFESMRQMLIDVATITSQIDAALTHVRNASASLGGGNLVDDILIAHRNLTGDLRSISYSIETVSTQFKTVFPDQESASHVSPADAAQLRRGWDQELHQSGLAAARAQSSLSRIEGNSRSAVAILERSKASVGDDGEGSRLAKLQALVQMLGVINSDLTTLSTTIATTERVNADSAAAAASAETLEAARLDRMMRGHAKDEPIPPVQTDILR